jgi:hypothetical protein
MGTSEDLAGMGLPGLWSLAFTAVASQPPSVLGGLLSLGLLKFLLFVMSRDAE